MLPSRPKMKTNRGSLLYPTRTGVGFRKLHKITVKATTDRELNIQSNKLKEELLAAKNEAENKGDKE